MGAHAVGYAATMRGQGSVLGLYATCTRLLGPTRHLAPWVREEYGSSFPMLQTLKDAFDPHGVMNMGTIIPN